MKKILVMLFLLAASMQLIAQPTTITYQGKLLDNVGDPVTQSGLAMTFAIYDSETAGIKLWPVVASVSKSVDVTDGLYSVTLGTGVGDDIAIGASILDAETPFLEVSVGGTPLSRSPLTNVPYSILSNTISAAGWASPGAIGGTTPSTAQFSNLTVGTGGTSYTLPAARGSNTQILVTDGSGNVTWQNQPGGSAIASFGYSYELATGGSETVVGGADVIFSNNGPLSGITHTAGTTTFTVPSTATYKVEYSISYTAGVGAAIAIAVNGTVDASTNVTLLTGAGNIAGTAILTLAAGDVLTLRNNSATPFDLDLSPAVGAQLTITQLD